VKIKDLFKIKKDLPMMTEMVIDNSNVLIIQLPFFSNQVILNNKIAKLLLLNWDQIYWFHSMQTVEEYLELLIDTPKQEILVIIC